MKLSLDGCKLLLIHVVLALVATAMVLPFTWMVLASLKRLQEIGLDSWIPTVFQWENYRDVFTMKGVQFGRWYWNSILVAAWVTFLQVFTSSLAAFSFSRLKWKGRDLVFLLYLATMMLPSLVMMIPNYQNMIYLGLVNTLQGLILPSAFSAFGTFLIRQFMMNIPSSLDEAAEIDGAEQVAALLDRDSAAGASGDCDSDDLYVHRNYNSMFWPLVMIKSPELYTLPIGMLAFDSSQGQQTNLLMAAVTMSIVPMILIFLFMQKQLVKGIMLGGVKG